MNSIITLELNELEKEKTELVLRHEKLPDTEAGHKHEEGWKVVLGVLGDYIEKG